MYINGLVLLHYCLYVLILNITNALSRSALNDNWKYNEVQDAPRSYRYYVFPVGMPLHSTLLCPRGFFIASQAYQLLYQIPSNQTEYYAFEDIIQTYKISYTQAVRYQLEYADRHRATEDSPVLLPLKLKNEQLVSHQSQQSKLDLTNVPRHASQMYNDSYKSIKGENSLHQAINNSRSEIYKLHNILNQQVLKSRPKGEDIQDNEQTSSAAPTNPSPGMYVEIE